VLECCEADWRGMQFDLREGLGFCFLSRFCRAVDAGGLGDGDVGRVLDWKGSHPSQYLPRAPPGNFLRHLVLVHRSWWSSQYLPVELPGLNDLWQ
jgi:hypothetical protein